ncbi:5-oxoprolinase component C [Nitrospira tepida]|uniref:5-oxoprolinase component C n=1 Tax=Nitrospira tepida TaxID=2973512 RepID=A0AA86TCQ3_9BACT|nr:biotin-dependent carboxyltransferase family protein [Nitrospira tepida]CAI4032194.1 5-oxoprolinase component C [Nitrospira tepida]
MMADKPARITVVKPGWFTTVQDGGRYGYQQYGMPVSGPMDRRSHVIANRLAGNRDQEAALEITLKGPELLFETASVVAVAGADLSPAINGVALPLWTSVPVKAGSRLVFGTRRSGARGYLAVAGGVDVPVVLGSRSTHVSSGTGGLKGRALAAGDCLIGGTAGPHQQAMIGRSLPERLRPSYSAAATLRILPGPQLSSFAPQAFDVLAANPYRLSSRSNRMGYRLEGPRLTQARAEARISDGTALGALQVPPDGQPILLMADRQTIGGYPIIAVVISADLHLAGQLLPGDTVSFTPTTLPEAQAILKAQWKDLNETMPPAAEVRP